MGWIIFSLFTMVVLVAILMLRRAMHDQPNSSLPGRNPAYARRVAGIVGGVMLAIWGVGTLLSSLHSVPTGSVGLIFQFGSIVGQTEEGLQFTAPWQSLSEVSTQVQRKKFDQFVPFSKETQDVSVIVSLNYRVSPGAVQNLYRTVGPKWFDVLIEPRVINFFKEETVKYQSVDIAPNREHLRLDVRKRLTDELKPFSIEVVDLLIDNIDFSATFKASIEGKQVATQDTLKAEQIVIQRRFEANQVIETARGEAEAVRVRAQGQADANKLISASLTAEVIQFQAVQKLGDNVQVAILPAGQGVLIDPTTLLTPPKKP